MAKAITGLVSKGASILGLGGNSSPTPTAPDPDSLSSRIANEREATKRYGQSGRSATVLDSGKLG